MKTKFSVALMLIMIVSLAFQVTASQALPGTYFTGTDNENNAHTGAADGDMDIDVYNDNPLHPIEFNIAVPVGGLPDTDAFLTIRAYDVDEEQGQKDEVFLNGTSLGFLSGTNNTWNTSAFAIPAGTLIEGNNLVQINVDTLNPPPDTTWLVVIDWGQVVVDGGVGTPGRINSITVTGYSVAGGNITLDVDVEIEALADGTFTLETNIYDPTANNVDADEQTGIVMTAGQILTRPVQFVFPEGANGDIYTIRGFLFDEATGLLNSIKSTTWSYTANLAPTSLTLSNRFIQEERPAGVVVGALSSTDPDLGDTATYSLVDTVACPGTDNGYFAVNGTNLVTSGTPRIDFQTKYYLTVCLRVTDSGGLTFDQPYTIVVRSIHQFPMDVDGDGKDDYVTFRPNTGTWHLRNLPPIVGFGQLGDLPVAADFNGDGKDDIAVFRPAATGQWLVRGQNPINFGTAGDVPLPLDFNGDKKADFAVFRPSTATWHIRGQLLTLAFGQTGDIPVPADYNGDGKAEIAVFRPSNGTWYFQNQPSVAFGTDGDIPVPFDYNNDGKADIAVYRPSNGTWRIRNIGIITFGGFYDQPFPMHLQSATTVNYVVIHAGAVAMEWQAQGLPTINFGANDDVHQ